MLRKSFLQCRNGKIRIGENIFSRMREKIGYLYYSIGEIGLILHTYPPFGKYICVYHFLKHFMSCIYWNHFTLFSNAVTLGPEEQKFQAI